MNIKLGSKINRFLAGVGIVITGVVLASSGSVLLPASSHAYPSNCTASINGLTAELPYAVAARVNSEQLSDVLTSLDFGKINTVHG